ncbi:MAG: hypothetical protein VXW72_01240, partial [Candidatus Thermoplasmatota archaeon]|nr:hypothetical protein [Candidatus Thermoplasmatota archaeon]
VTSQDFHQKTQEYLETIRTLPENEHLHVTGTKNDLSEYIGEEHKGISDWALYFDKLEDDVLFVKKDRHSKESIEIPMNKLRTFEVLVKPVC